MRKRSRNIPRHNLKNSIKQLRAELDIARKTSIEAAREEFKRGYVIGRAELAAQLAAKDGYALPNGTVWRMSRDAEAEARIAEAAATVAESAAAASEVVPEPEPEPDEPEPHVEWPESDPEIDIDGAYE